MPVSNAVGVGGGFCSLPICAIVQIGFIKVGFIRQIKKIQLRIVDVFIPFTTS